MRKAATKMLLMLSTPTLILCIAYKYAKIYIITVYTRRHSCMCIRESDIRVWVYLLGFIKLYAVALVAIEPVLVACGANRSANYSGKLALQQQHIV